MSEIVIVNGDSVPESPNLSAQDIAETVAESVSEVAETVAETVAEAVTEATTTTPDANSEILNRLTTIETEVRAMRSEQSQVTDLLTTTEPEPEAVAVVETVEVVAPPEAEIRQPNWIQRIFLGA